MSLVETAEGTITTKRFAVRTEIQWDPATNGGGIIFYVEKFTYLDGVLLSRVADGYIRGDLAELMERTFVVPIGPETTMDVPAPLVMATMKKAYEDLYEEQNTILLPPSMSESEEPVV